MSGTVKTGKLADLLSDAGHEISKGMTEDGYRKLNQKFPEFLNKLNQKLNENFTKAGIIEYRDCIIRGLKKIDCWNEK